MSAVYFKMYQIRWASLWKEEEIGNKSSIVKC